ncbi:MAG: PilZ domain-containing protein [Acidobacteriota bacterium]
MRKRRKSASHEVREEPRKEVELKAIVQGHTSPEDKWKETVTVENVSRSGASFHLGHGCNIGTLLTIVLPLPAELRAYDLNENVYPAIGLVQYCTETINNGDSSYKVGVAFVGKTFPDSYLANPMQNYHIAGSQPSGIWKITESSAPFTPRGGVRYWAPTDATISLFQRENRIQSKEDARALNISSTGALIVGTLQPEKDERVKLAFKEHDFYTLATVRNCRPAKEGKWAVHLEFFESRFPLKKIVDALAKKKEIDLPDEELQTQEA